MKYMLGYCGVECSKCAAYIATINNDDDLRRRYAAEQSEFFGMEILPEQNKLRWLPRRWRASWLLQHVRNQTLLPGKGAGKLCRMC